jgi:prepilin-type N-terminal cleavage/methylation domain-containing protein
MKTNHRMRSGFTLVELLVVITIIAALAALSAPMILKQQSKAYQTEAISNARQIGLALTEFETEYGSFPDDTTAEAVATGTDTTKVVGSKANDRFRQLIRAGIAQSELMFYAKTSYTKKPDGVFNNDSSALAPGEVGFGLMGKAGGTALSNGGNPSRPVAMAPFDAVLDGEKFDYDVYGGKAVILRLDNSVTSVSIIKTTGYVKINGKSLTQTGDDTVWGTSVTPAIVYPAGKGS